MRQGVRSYLYMHDGQLGALAGLPERDIEPHVPLIAGKAREEVPTRRRRTVHLKRARHRKGKEALARKRVGDDLETRGCSIRRSLRIRSNHILSRGR